MPSARPSSTLPLVSQAPGYTFRDEEGQCRFQLKETGIYHILCEGILTQAQAAFICEHLSLIQAHLRQQSDYLSLFIEIQTHKATPQARNYLLRQLRWQRTGRVLRVFIYFPDSLSRSILLLIGKVNQRTHFEILKDVNTGLEQARTYNTSFFKQHQLLSSVPPLPPELWNTEIKAYHYQTTTPPGRVHFFQPHPAILYIYVTGRVSRQLLDYLIPTYQALFNSIIEQPKSAIVVDFSHGIHISNRLIFEAYRKRLPSSSQRLLYLIPPPADSAVRLTPLLRFVIDSFFKNAYVVSTYAEVRAHFDTVHKTPSPLLPQFQCDEHKHLKEWITYQDELIRTERKRHEAELTQIRNIIWNLLLRESSQPMHIDIPQEDNIAAEVLQLLDVFQRDQLQLIKDLQLQIDDRTRAEHAAAQANEIKNEFLAAMSHDIRTPLNAILGFTKVLQLNKKAPLNAEQTLYLQRIQENGQNLLSLVNDILDLSQLESGKVLLHIEEVNLYELTQKIVAQMEVLIVNKALKVTVDIAPEILYTDKKRLQQIVINLLNNAIKFTEPQGRISLKYESTDKGVPKALHIEDTGCGIAAEAQARIFEAFERENTTVNKEGSGLGLAICTRLSQHLGYHLGVKSTPGTGSTFSLYFYPKGKDGQRS